MIKRICAVFFSPTGGTERLCTTFTKRLSSLLEVPAVYHNYTAHSQQVALSPFLPTDLLVWASPTYAGRLPNKMLEYIKSNLRGSDTPAVAMVTYGGRNFDNSLAEMVGIMEDNGCRPVSAMAFVSKHAFSDSLAIARPDKEDKAQVEQYAMQVAQKIGANNWSNIDVVGDKHPQKYYTPLTADLTPAQFLKAKPIVDKSKCSGCGECERRCPMGSIEMDEGYPVVKGVCIKCHACISHCTHMALRLIDSDFLSHVKMLENHYDGSQKPIIFI